MSLTQSLILLKNKISNKYTAVKRNDSWWSGVAMGPPDPIFGVTEAFKRDSNPKKINLGVGAYRDDDGKPYVLPCVLKAEEIIASKKLNKEYPPMTGYPEFCKLAAGLALGQCSDIVSNELNATAQSLSGTGALSLGAAFLKRHFPGNKVVYLPQPTWGNHNAIMKYGGLETKTYKYYDPQKFWLDFEGIMKDVCKIPEKSIILFHVCAHNPTGVDPSKEQWAQLSEVVKHKKLFTFFDFAYQGFASGDAENDAFAVRQFSKDGNKFLLAQSFAKNMGLYGERIGSLSVISDCKEETDKIMSQLKMIIRPVYSVPPIHGARIIIEILSDSKLKEQWSHEVKCMAERIKSVRSKLVEDLKKVGSTRNWDHITKQIGMFCYTGMTPEQVEKITKQHSIYLTKDGRISIAGVSSKNVEYLANAMHDVTK